MNGIPLDEVVHFDEITCGADRAAVDADSTPTFSVFEEATDTPVLSAQNFTKRTSLTGNYRGTFTASAANGFEVGKWYNVISTATVDGVTGKKKSMTFRLVAAEGQAGYPKVDVAYGAGVVVSDSDFTIASATETTVTLPTTYTGGGSLPDDDRYVYSVLQVVAGTGTGQNILLTTPGSSAREYNVLPGTMPVQLDNTSKCIVSGTWRAEADGLVIARGTIGSTGNSTTALHLTGLTYGDDELNNHLIAVRDVSAGEWHARWITDWADTGDLATVATLPFTPENAVDTYAILAFRQDVTGGSGLDAAGVRAAIGLASANLDTQLGAIDDYLDTEVAAIKAKTDNLPSDPADASDIASSFSTVNSTLSTIAGYIDTEVAAIKAKTDNLPSDPADASDIASSFSTVNSTLSTIQTRLNGLVMAQGTIGSTGNSTTALHLTGLTYGDDELNNHLIVIFDVSTSEYHARWITDWADTGDLATVATLPFTPQNATDTYWILPIRQDVTGGSGLDAAGVRAAIGLASANLDTQLSAIDNYIDTEVAAIASRVTTALPDAAPGTEGGLGVCNSNLAVPADIAAVDTESARASMLGALAFAHANGAFNASVSDVTGKVLGGGSSAITDTGVRADLRAWNGTAPSNLISGRVDANVGAMQTDTITSAAVAASAVTEIQSGLSTLDAAGVRTAVGLASANLDTQLTAIDDYLDTEVAAIKAKTDNLPSDPAAVGSAMTLTSGERNSVADALLDRADALESSWTLRKSLRQMLRVLAAKTSGMGTTTATIRDMADTKNAVTATVDGDGNRTAITHDAT